MSEGMVTGLVSVVIIAAAVMPYVLIVRRKERRARERLRHMGMAEQSAGGMIHPHIDALLCIGCGGCVTACPEGDVLAIVDGKASLVNPSHCIGHGLCADACPVGGITLLTAAPGKRADLPILSSSLETSVPGLFIAGELGGLGLIKNAVMQGAAVGKEIAKRLSQDRDSHGDEIREVIIVGAGPAGLATALALKEAGVRYALFEQGDAGGTILQYPRRKIVMTAPVELPVWGPLKFRETTKENLLGIWNEIVVKTGLEVHNHERVTGIRREETGFHVETPKGSYRSRFVVLTLGRRGTPRKLGVPGEDRSKVMYQLMDASTYRNAHLLVVGGGDSAVEAAIGLTIQKSNHVTLSYRKSTFSRLKARNEEHLRYYQKKGSVRLMMGSTVEEIGDTDVALRTGEKLERIPNEYVFVFAGGELPYEFLRGMGVEFHRQEVA